MILELFSNILNNTIMYKNNMKGGAQYGQATAPLVPLQQSLGQQPIVRQNSLNFAPRRSNTLTSSAQSLALSASPASPDASATYNDPSNDGMSDEMAGLCMLLLVVIFGLVIAIWLYTEKRVLKKDMKSQVKSETKPEVVVVKN